MNHRRRLFGTAAAAFVTAAALTLGAITIAHSGSTAATPHPVTAAQPETPTQAAVLNADITNNAASASLAALDVVHSPTPIVLDVSWWKDAQCVAAIAWVALTFGVAVAKAIKIVGGAGTLASILFSKGENSGYAERALGAFAWILGLDAIRNNC